MSRLRRETVNDGATATVRLEGRMIGAWVDEVRRSCRDALGRGATVTLDLSAVSFVDADGVVLLRELASRQVVLANATPFVAVQLKG